MQPQKFKKQPPHPPPISFLRGGGGGGKFIYMQKEKHPYKFECPFQNKNFF